MRARYRSLLPTAPKNESSAHHSFQKTVSALRANVMFEFFDESRSASAWQGTECTCKVTSKYAKRGARCARQSSRSSFRVRRGKRFVLVYTATPGRPSRTHDCSRFPCLVPRRGPCVSNSEFVMAALELPCKQCKSFSAYQSKRAPRALARAPLCVPA